MLNLWFNLIKIKEIKYEKLWIKLKLYFFKYKTKIVEKNNETYPK